jgi:hypothetical protein
VIGRHRTFRAVVALTAVLASSCAIAAAAGWTVSASGTPTGSAKGKSAPAAPASQSATCVSSSSRTVRISWTAESGAPSYTISDSTTGSTGTSSQYAVGVTSNLSTTSNLPSGTYYFKVAAQMGTSWIGSQTTATSGRQIQLSQPNCQ